MTPTADALLATLSAAAYSDTPVALPAGFTALDPSNFNMPLQPGESFANGIFKSGNGAALLNVGFIEGQAAIVVSFRGSDDTTDSLQDLNNINAAYASFGTLVKTVDLASAVWGIPVVVTGHSLGGSLAQLYMQDHPNQPGQPGHAAVTFGSGGAILPAGTDERILNYVIADDPAVFIGAHRAEIGDALRANPTLADVVAAQVAEDFPGLSKAQALASLPNLTVTTTTTARSHCCPTGTARSTAAPTSPTCRGSTPRGARRGTLRDRGRPGLCPGPLGHHPRGGEHRPGAAPAAGDLRRLAPGSRGLAGRHRPAAAELRQQRHRWAGGRCQRHLQRRAGRPERHRPRPAADLKRSGAGRSVKASRSGCRSARRSR
ncbi:hypothetical protein [Dankookia sp. P2]|uniref:hypothetical protein n=1 Tax=Dankookia sp. P2 TaxID=3423955 RepID=UPI003D67AA81